MAYEDHFADAHYAIENQLPETLSKNEEHFVDRHGAELIQRVVLADPILDDLYQWELLTREQYDSVRRRDTSQEKMRELYWYIGSWRDEDKDRLLESLRRHNPDLIGRLGDSETMEKLNVKVQTSRLAMPPKLRQRSRRPMKQKEEDGKPEISRIQATRGGSYQSLQSPTPNLTVPLPDEHSGSLSSYVEHFPAIPYTTSNWSTETLSKNVQHFVDRHRADLIQRVVLVDPILDDLFKWNLLTRGQYDTVRSFFTSQDKMQQLYRYMQSWRDEDKERLLESLRRHYCPLITSLEDSETMEKLNMKAQTSGVAVRPKPKAKKQKVEDVKPEISRKLLVIGGSYQSLQSPTPNLTVPLPDEHSGYLSSWELCFSPRLLRPNLTVPYLDVRSGSLSSYEDHFVDRHRAELIERLTPVAPLLDHLYQWKLLTHEQYNILRNIITRRIQMRQLYYYMGSWRDEDKDRLLVYLRRHYPELIRRLEGPEHFVDRHRNKLIQQVDNVSPILDDLYQWKLLTYEQYNTVRRIITRQDQMRELYCYMRSWRREDKERLLESLRRHNPDLIRRLEAPGTGGGEISVAEEKKKTGAGESPEISASQQSGDDTKPKKDYKTTPESTIPAQTSGVTGGSEQKAEKQEEEDVKLEESRMQLKSGESFTSLQSMYVTPPKTLPLLEDILDFSSSPGTGVAEEKKNAGAGESPGISASQQSGDHTKPKKDTKTTAESTITAQTSGVTGGSKHKSEKQEEEDVKAEKQEEDVKAEKSRTQLKSDQEHFVNKHQDKLIQRVVNVAPILDDLYLGKLLTQEEYNIVRHIYTSQDQMRQLYWYMGSWRDEDKERFLESVRRHNPDLIGRLEGPEHFVDKHQEELIQRVDNVDPILDDLYQRHLLVYEQYNIVHSIITSHGQMRQLFWYMGSWRDEDKERLLESLRRHNPELIGRLEEMKEPHGGAVSDVSSTKTFAAGDKMAEAIEQPDVEPQCISDKKYRVEVQSMFHCQETGIKFEVETTAIIEYSLEYGDDYMKVIQDNGYELLGPIFNVQVLSGLVSAVYLPHYVCLDGFLDKSLIKFGDFKGGNLTLKIPTRIESSYVVLENPTFTPVAPVGKQRTSASGKKRRYPFNGMVFLYFRVVCPNNNDRAEYRIHLYLIPVGRCHIKNLTEQKEKEGFQKISKPPQTKSVYADVNYIIRGEPDADIEPKTLELKIHKEIEKCPYTEINFSKKAISQSEKPIILCVIDKKSSESEPVWRGRLTRDIEELAEAKAAQKGDPPRSFIDEHYSELVQRVDNIMPVLDELKEKDLLTGEQYNTVESQTTAQEKMRKLLSFVGSWSSDDKETFLKIAKSHNKSNIKKIEKGN
ncbi:uncharacterized protein [Dendropsophus ebraccatus]|uniref:uncharacterized protein isoform X2 n=1 Tax=Dendropsophus ebraccatus TaxID=150705 RepID=UPI0038312BA6